METRDRIINAACAAIAQPPEPASATLSGSATDDGWPNPPGKLTTTWSQVSGAGVVTFGNASALSTSASFTTAGTYVLKLTANDGSLSASSAFVLTVVFPEQLPLAEDHFLSGADAGAGLC